MPYIICIDRSEGGDSAIGSPSGEPSHDPSELERPGMLGTKQDRSETWGEHWALPPVMPRTSFNAFC